MDYYDIWTDKFIDELKRREDISGWKFFRWLEGEVTKEKIIEAYKQRERNKRWGYLFE